MIKILRLSLNKAYAFVFFHDTIDVLAINGVALILTIYLFVIVFSLSHSRRAFRIGIYGL